MNIDSNMKMVGKRFPFLATYQVKGVKKIFFKQQFFIVVIFHTKHTTSIANNCETTH